MRKTADKCYYGSALQCAAVDAAVAQCLLMQSEFLQLGCYCRAWRTRQEDNRLLGLDQRPPQSSCPLKDSSSVDPDLFSPHRSALAIHRAAAVGVLFRLAPGGNKVKLAPRHPSRLFSKGTCHSVDCKKKTEKEEGAAERQAIETMK